MLKTGLPASSSSRVDPICWLGVALTFDVDLDHGFQPTHAARAVANQFDRYLALSRFGA